MKKYLSVLLSLTMLVLIMSSLCVNAGAAYYSTAFIGDSICGMGYWNEYFERSDIDNYGKGGATSAKVLEIYKAVEKKYDRLFIICGINDKKLENWSYDVSIANYKAIIEHAISTNPEIRIYSVGLLPSAGQYANLVDEGYQKEYNKRLAALADEYENVTFISVYESLCDPETGYYMPDYTSDGLHPEYEGFMKLADVLRPYVNEKKIITIDGGDINSDGGVDILDVAILRASIIGSKTLSDDEKAQADVNGDELCDIIDVAVMRNYIVNK